MQGWSRQRRVVILRRRVRGALATPAMDEDGPPRLAFLDIGPSEEMWEYQVLATTLLEALESFGQLYRDRGDGENVFDELKNQWGWGGFVTHDLARCRLAARLVALFYDWWNIFTRLAEPIATERRSRADHCCCTPSPNGCAMRDKRRSRSPARTPSPFPPQRRFER